MKKNIPIGSRFGRLTTTSIPYSGKPIPTRKDKRPLVIATCDCGSGERMYVLSNLTTGNTSSCGCFNKEQISKAKIKHGFAYKHPLYNVWKGINSRCYNPKHSSYHNYGGRGISVCDEWRNNFKAFYDWAMTNGYNKGLTVDRFPNNDGNYEPSNCILSTRKAQARHKRNNVLTQEIVDRIRKDIPNFTVAQLAKKYKQNYGHIQKIIKNEIWN